jgi:hypothetical protein
MRLTMRSPTLATFLFGFVFVGCGGGQTPPLLVVVPEVASAAPVTEQPAALATQPPEKAQNFEWTPLDDARDDRGHQRFFEAPSIVSDRALWLEGQAKTMGRTDAARPEVLRKLADTYCVIALQKRSAGEPDAAVRASKMAVTHFLALSRDYPNDPKIDEVFYYAALESERAADLDHARRLYLDLIMKQPRSRLVPYAYFAFGEIFFQSAASDPSKVPPAKLAFEKALQDLRPGDRLHPFAQSRLDEVKALAGAP